LEHFYIAYRAHVRAKVAALSNDDAGASQRSALALDHLERGEIRLVLVGGPPATGKTTTARAIAAATGWPVLRSDAIRKELAGLEETSDASAAIDAGIYTPAWTERTYTDLCDRARDLLSHGCSVVLDASWNSPPLRELAARVATDTMSRLIALHCEAPSEVTTTRAARRFAGHEDPSDADATIAAMSAARFAPWPEARVLDTTATRAEVTSATLSILGRY
jgi:predicted kinase